MSSSSSSTDSLDEMDRYSRREELVKKIRSNYNDNTDDNADDVEELIRSFRLSIDSSNKDYNYINSLIHQINSAYNADIFTYNEQNMLTSYALNKFNLIG